MCPPPPSDPIRPIGPVDGDVYVERSAFAERVARRRGRGEDGQRRQGHPHDEDEADEPELPPDWFEAAAPLKAAGAYDDHGRTAATDADETEHPHVDRTA